VGSVSELEFKPLDIEQPIAQYLRELKTVDPELRKQFTKDAKRIAVPVQTAIKSALPTVAPLSGMYEPGRMGWDVGVPHDKTVVKFKGTRSREKAVTPLLSIWVMSPLIAMLDMAGKASRGRDSGRSREYDYRGGRRRHRINGQGRYMIDRLGRNPSRYVYPAGERARAAIENELKAIIDVVANRINRRLD
jgi:hypothetical protein